MWVFLTWYSLRQSWRTSNFQVLFWLWDLFARTLVKFVTAQNLGDSQMQREMAPGTKLVFRSKMSLSKHMVHLKQDICCQISPLWGGHTECKFTKLLVSHTARQQSTPHTSMLMPVNPVGWRCLGCSSPSRDRVSL